MIAVMQIIKTNQRLSELSDMAQFNWLRIRALSVYIFKIIIVHYLDHYSGTIIRTYLYYLFYPYVYPTYWSTTCEKLCLWLIISLPMYNADIFLNYHLAFKFRYFMINIQQFKLDTNILNIIKLINNPSKYKLVWIMYCTYIKFYA